MPRLCYADSIVGVCSRAKVSAVIAGLTLFLPEARAQDPGGTAKSLPLQPLKDSTDDEGRRRPEATDPRDEVPRHAFVESPFNLQRGTVFASGTAQVVPTEQKTLTSGGVRIGASPVERLSAHVLLGRNAANGWSPSATAHLRILGSLQQGFALGLMATYKAEGFSELGGEAEVGVTAGFRTTRFYLDMNAVGGRGLEEHEEGETDGELKLRTGYSLTPALRLGVEGQARRRFSGAQLAPNGRQWDAYGGPQLVAALGTFVLAATGGVTNATPDGHSGGFGLMTVSFLQERTW